MNLNFFLKFLIFIFLLNLETSVLIAKSIPNQYIIKFNPIIKSSTAQGQSIIHTMPYSLTNALSNHNLKSIRHLGPTPNMNNQGFSISTTTTTPKKNYLSNLALIELENPVGFQDIYNELKSIPGIIYVEPNYIYEIPKKINSFPTIKSIPKETPNDPFLSDQSYLSILNMEKAWAATHGDVSAVIAIIDTGIDTTHVELKNQLWINKGEIKNNGIDDDNNGFIDDIHGWDFVLNQPNVIDQNSHGTHVSGIVGAQTNNNIGIASVGHSIKIMSLRAGDASGTLSSSAILSALNYAISNGASVINMSFGGDAISTLNKELLATANAEGIFLVASAGNSNSDISVSPNFPSSLSTVYAVSAAKLLNSSTLVFDSSYSNFGSSIDFIAPGTDIISTIPNSRLAFNTGTSMSAPIISGIFGLLKDAFPNKSKTELYNALKNTALDLGDPGKDDLYGHGLPQVFDALLSLDVDTPTLSHTLHAPQNIGNEFVITLSATDDLISTTLPIVTINYNVISESGSTGWLSKRMTKISSTNYSEAVALVSTISTINYYFTAQDIVSTHTVTLPTTAPSTFFTMQMLDIEGPTFTFNKIPQDFISLTATINVNINDNTTINVSSITATINSILYTLSSPVLTFTTPNLSINFSQISIPLDNPTTIIVSATDIFGNANSKQIQLNNQTSVPFIYGSQGIGSPIINAPNPFNPNTETTKIGFQITTDTEIKLQIFTLNQRKVFSNSYNFQTGYNEIEWNGKNDSNQHLPNGVYIAVLTCKSQGKKIIERLKIALVKK